MSTDALTTAEIDGEIVGRASVQSSIRKRLGLETDMRRVRPAEQGIRLGTLLKPERILLHSHFLNLSRRADEGTLDTRTLV